MTSKLEDQIGWGPLGVLGGRGAIATLHIGEMKGKGGGGGVWKSGGEGKGSEEKEERC